MPLKKVFMIIEALNLVKSYGAVKAVGLLLYAPIIDYLFPQRPQWISKIFPTYYIIQPVAEINQQGGCLVR